MSRQASDGAERGQCLQVEEGAGPTTLLVFSSRDAERFDYAWIAAQVGCKRVLVRDPSGAGWYNRGLPGLGESIEEIASALAVVIGGLSGERLLVLGSSMGGYAAILFGCLLGAEKVLAFSPQTWLDQCLPIAPPPDAPIQVADLQPILAAHPRTLVEIVCSDDDLQDLLHAGRVFALPNIKVKTLPYTEHWVALQLHEQGKLLPTVARWVFDEASGLPSGAARLDDPGFRRAVTDGAIAFFSGDHQAAHGHMAPSAASNPGHAGLQHCFGISLWRLKRFAEAEAALRRAIAARPGWAHAIHFLALAVVMQRRETEAEPLFRISAEMTREPWAEAHFWIGYCLDSSGYVDAAASEMRRALAIKPSLPDPTAWLRRKGLVL